MSIKKEHKLIIISVVSAILVQKIIESMGVFNWQINVLPYSPINWILSKTLSILFLFGIAYLTIITIIFLDKKLKLWE